MVNHRFWALGWTLLLAAWLSMASAGESLASAQETECGELQCVLPGGGCGWPGNGGCYADIQEAECYQAGGCNYVAGDCYVPADGGCYPVPKAECIMAGGAWEDGQCVFPPINGGNNAVPEPRSLSLMVLGLASFGMYVIRRRRRVGP
jgi:hypothetical protein